MDGVKMQKIQKIKELVKYLNELRDSYYNDSISKVSDPEYDKLFDELNDLEKETGFVLSNSPTVTVGYEVNSSLQKVEHSHPMLSLDKTKSTDDLVAFAGDKDTVLSLKMDGLTILLTYEDGELVRAETRGNGYQGELITANARVFENIPLKIDYAGTFEIEGEAIITYDDFDKINADLVEDEKYKNPRNLASGSVRQLDSSIAAKRHLKFIAWKVPTVETTMVEAFGVAEELGFTVVPYIYLEPGMKEPEKYIEKLKTIATQLGYPIDGLVCSFNDIRYGKSLGETGHHPRHFLAFKFADDVYETELLNIDWTMGKTGILTPTAVFKAVEIDGTNVERASIHNISIMKELSDGGVWYKGMKISVFKANLIIPQVSNVIWGIDEIENVADEERMSIPNKCPICGGETVVMRDNDTEFLVCNNLDCKGKLLGKLTHFCGRDAMNIDGLSEQTLNRFIELGWLTDFIDIYHLDQYKTKMMTLDKFGKKSVEKLIQSIEKSKDTTLERFLYALSIPLIGKTATKDIAKYCHGSFEEFTEHMALSRGKAFLEIDGFGDTMWEKLDDFWSENCAKVVKLVKNGIKVGGKSTPNERQILSGKTFVITGSLEHYKNRNDLVATIESNGGKVSGSISAKTNYLINNDKRSSSSKNKKAKELNIPIISEQDFINMIF